MEKEEIINTQKSFIRWQITFVILLVALLVAFMYFRASDKVELTVQYDRIKSFLAVALPTRSSM